VFARNIVCSRIGRAFVAVRDGEVAAQSLGIDLLRYKALAFALSGLYAGIGGGLYSALLNFVAPEGFDLFQMILQKSMIVVGGLGSVAGAVLGAAMVVVLLEALREVKGAQELVFGALLVMFVLFLRGGLVSMIKRHVRGWEEPLRAQ
jgi:branched-chain amino acid transport system permease protein